MVQGVINPEHARLWRESFLLAQTPEETVDDLLAEGWRVLPFRRGQIIFGYGENTDCLGIVVNGRAAARNGNGILLRDFNKGDIFGVEALFIEDAESFGVVLAESSGEALLLPIEVVRTLMQTQPQTAVNYIRYLARRIVYLNNKISSLSSGGAIRRVATHIISASRPDMLGRPAYPVNFSRLTQSLGISRASIYRALDILSENGCLHREGKTVIVDNMERLCTYR